MVGAAVLVGHHAHDLRAFHLGLERAAHAAVGARGDLAVIGLAVVDDRLLHQRGGGTGLHAGTARDAFGRQEVGRARGDHGSEAAAVDRQGESALHFLARAHAARADDALGRIEGEVRVGGVLLRAQMIGAVVAIAHVAQPHDAGHLLQLAVAVRRAGEAVERVVGDVELHHAAAQLRELARLRPHLHAGLHERGAGGGVALAALDLHQAQAAGAEGLEHVGGAQLGHAYAGLGRGAHHRGARRHRDGHAVDLQRDEVLGYARGRSRVQHFDRVHSFLRPYRLRRPWPPCWARRNPRGNVRVR